MSPVEQPRGREGHEPEETPRGVPMVVLAVVAFIAAWGAYTFVSEVQDGLGPYGDQRTLAALEPTPVKAAPEGGGLDGEAIYSAR